MNSTKRRTAPEPLTAKRLTEIVGEASRKTKVIAQFSSIGYDTFWENVLELLSPYLKNQKQDNDNG